MPDPAAVLVFLDLGQAHFERRLRVDAVQVIERDAFRLEAPKTLLDLGAQHLRTPLASLIAALGRDSDCTVDARQGIAEGQDGYVVSIHVWEPLAGTERVLRRIVASTP